MLFRSANINPLYQGFFFDQTNEYTVPYGAGIPLIVYNPESIDFEITSYNDLWDARLKNNISILGNYRVIEGIVLKTMGESFNTNDLAVIREAGDKLLELAPNIRVINDTSPQDALISGEVAVAFMYTSQVVAAMEANPKLKVVYPSEGLGFGIMAAFVPSNAPNGDLAHKFLSFINQPEQAAACFEYLNYYCTNKAAETLIAPEKQVYLVVPSDVTNGETISNISQEAEDLHAENWQKFRAQCK